MYMHTYVYRHIHTDTDVDRFEYKYNRICRNDVQHSLQKPCVHHHTVFRTPSPLMLPSLS